MTFKMNSIFFKKNKKGGIDLSLSEIVTLVFGGLILIALVAFIFNLHAAFSSDSDDGSKANFDRLYDTIKELINSDDDLEEINYYIGKDRTLVGFHTNWDDSIETTGNLIFGSKGYSFTGNTYKPFECGDPACLCLYEGKFPTKLDKRNEGIIECRSDGLSGVNIVFSGRGASGTQRLHIEKTYDTSTDTFFIDISIS